MTVNPAAKPQSHKGVVERAFYFQGKVLKKGETHELPRLFALEMQAANKFKINHDQEPAPAPTAEEPKESKGKKGAKDAQ